MTSFSSLLTLKTSGLLYATLIVICHGQFLTPEQLREQYELSYGVRTHYEPSGSRRIDLFNRANPDYLLDGNGYFFSKSNRLIN